MPAPSLSAGSFVPRPVFDFAMIGAALALGGTYWDDAWHTDRGRDSFWAPPHLMLYGGAVVLAAVVVLAVGSQVSATRDLRAVFRHRGVVLATVGVASVFVAAPIDEMWHRLLGRDAVLWSPPHLLGLTGSLAALTGVIDLARPLGRFRSSVAGAAILATAMISVLEYETDVPQFDEALYLPVVTASFAVAAVIIGRRNGRRWALSEAAIVYTVARVVVTLGLDASGHSSAIVVPILAIAVVADLCRHRWQMGVVTATAIAAAALIYVPWHGAIPNGLDLGTEDLAAAALGIPAAFLVLLIAGELSLGSGSRIAAQPTVLALLCVVTLVGVAGPAGAHDPGQGEEVGRVELIATPVEIDHDRSRISITARLLEPGTCDGLEATGSVARRAGERAVGDLRAQGSCTWAGVVVVDSPGRWFVYVEFAGDRRVESWLPVLTTDSRAREVRPLYEPPEERGSAPLRVGVGSLVWLMNAALAALVLRS